MYLPLPLSPDHTILPSFPHPCTSRPPVWLRYGVGTGGGLGTWGTTSFASEDAALPVLPPAQPSPRHLPIKAALALQLG